MVTSPFVRLFYGVIKRVVEGCQIKSRDFSVHCLTKGTQFPQHLQNNTIVDPVANIYTRVRNPCCRKVVLLKYYRKSATCIEV